MTLLLCLFQLSTSLQFPFMGVMTRIFSLALLPRAAPKVTLRRRLTLKTRSHGGGLCVWGGRALPDIMISDGKQELRKALKKKVNRCGIYMSVDPLMRIFFGHICGLF